MFDGVLNSGLYITDHLQHGLQSKLPIHALTITAWFTISEATLNAGSLIAVQQEEGHCHKGWSLSYMQFSPHFTTLVFKVALQADGLISSSAFTTIKVEVEPPLAVGQWNHIAAIYNGSALEIYLNGELKGSLRACGNTSCGRIVYPDADTSVVSE